MIQALKTITAVVETVPTASKVGSSMFKRVSHYAKILVCKWLALSL